MWNILKASVSPTTQRCSIVESDRRLNFSEVLELWRSSARFRDEWTRCLASLPYAGYCLETPPLDARTVRRSFECVFVESPGLVSAAPDPAPFRDFIGQQDGPGSVQFRSLGGDAVLVAPRARPGVSYGHLAGFVRDASPDESRQLWRVVAEAVTNCLGSEPVWLSTAGLGVSWLHVRIDSRPKYYRHQPYTDRDFWEHQ